MSKGAVLKMSWTESVSDFVEGSQSFHETSSWGCCSGCPPRWMGSSARTWASGTTKAVAAAAANGKRVIDFILILLLV